MSRARASSALFLAVYTAVLWALLLSPLEFYTRNGATWAPGDRAITFPSPGVVRTIVPPRRLHRDLTSGTGFTLEVWLRAGNSDQTGPARIVSYSKDTGVRNFTLGQDRDKLDIRLRTTETGLNGTPSLEVPGVFALDERRHVIVTYDFQLLCAYIDGQRRICRSSPAGGLANWHPEHDFLLGNERTATRPWLGTLFLVALYDRPLSETEIGAAHRAAAASMPLSPATTQGLVVLYPFGEGSGDVVHDARLRAPVDLAIPQALHERRCGFLSVATGVRQTLRLTVLEISGNVLLFFPFGFLLLVVFPELGWSRQASLVAAVAIPAVVTVAIESFQYLLVWRCSQLEDVALNLLGACLGVLAASAWTRQQPG